MLGCNPNLGSNQSMSLSQIKFAPSRTPSPPHFHLPQDISKEIHIFFGGENNRIRRWPAAVLTSVFTGWVWIKEKAVVLAPEQVGTKGQSIPKVPWPRLRQTYIHVSKPVTLHAISLYLAWVHSEIRSSNFGLQIDRGINQRIVELGDIIVGDSGSAGKFSQRL